MANLPTAYASQRFGRKTLDFYAVEGDVVGADPRARAEERRLEDMDGQRHTVRLMEKNFELQPGQTATVLRMQPGPARRSRPVAVVNHDTGNWCRTHPGADGLLAKAGVARTFNWVLSMGLFAIAALALIWPFLRAFLVEVDPAVFGATPALNMGELAIGLLPALSSWSFSEAIAPLTGPLVAAVPALAGSADMLVFAAGTVVTAFGVYILRSWRLLWAPLFVAALGVVALGYGGVAGMIGPALSGLGIASLIFLLGGVVNRIRDGARLEARIAVLSDHLLRQGPQEAVMPANDDVEPEADVHELDAVVPVAAAATAASLREPGQGDDEEAATEVVEAESDEAVEETAELETGAEIAPEVETVEEVEQVESEVDSEVVEAVEGAEAEVAAEETAPDIDAEAEAAVAAAALVEADEGIEEPEGEDVQAEAAEAPADEASVAESEAVAEGAEMQADGTSEAEAEAAAVVEDDDLPAIEDVSQSAEPESQDLSADTTPAGLDPEEAERLRTDPRYASRAIVLPPPPPMPAPVAGEGTGEAVGHGETTTLRPSAPLPTNVIPIFAAPASSEITPGEPKADRPDGADDEPREPA